MATTIKVKRKISKGNDGITLKKGEPYYNLHDKHFYVGSPVDGEEDIISKDKKHIAQVTEITKEDGRVVFQIGEDPENVIDIKNAGVSSTGSVWKSFSASNDEGSN